jgi:hypothetical protein
MFKRLLALFNRKRTIIDFDSSVQQYQSTIQELQEENKRLQGEKQLYQKKIKAKNTKIRELESHINIIKNQLVIKQKQGKAGKSYTSPNIVKEKLKSSSEKINTQKPLNKKLEMHVEDRNQNNATSENDFLRKLAFVTKLPADPFLKNHSGVRQSLSRRIRNEIYECNPNGKHLQLHLY